jgi:hypothetical protein
VIPGVKVEVRDVGRTAVTVDLCDRADAACGVAGSAAAAKGSAHDTGTHQYASLKAPQQCPCVIRKSFAAEYGNGNRIPASMINPVAKNFQTLLLTLGNNAVQQPTNVGTSQIVQGVVTNNYAYSTPGVNTTWSVQHGPLFSFSGLSAQFVSLKTQIQVTFHKLFFFFDFDKTLSPSSSIGHETLPLGQNAAMANGDFTAAGMPTIFDPTTQTIQYDVSRITWCFYLRITARQGPLKPDLFPFSPRARHARICMEKLCQNRARDQDNRLSKPQNGNINMRKRFHHPPTITVKIAMHFSLIN